MSVQSFVLDMSLKIRKPKVVLPEVVLELSEDEVSLVCSVDIDENKDMIDIDFAEKEAEITLLSL